MNINEWLNQTKEEKQNNNGEKKYDTPYGENINEGTHLMEIKECKAEIRKTSLGNVLDINFNVLLDTKYKLSYVKLSPYMIKKDAKNYDIRNKVSTLIKMFNIDHSLLQEISDKDELHLLNKLFNHPSFIKQLTSKPFYVSLGKKKIESKKEPGKVYYSFFINSSKCPISFDMDKIINPKPNISIDLNNPINNIDNIEITNNSINVTNDVEIQENDLPF